MPDKTECQRCHKTGFVRVEHVIKAQASVRHFYCGYCNHSWAVADGAQPQNHGYPPERSRPADG